MTSPYATPPMESATDPIASPADLRQRWRALMEPLGFGERLLRFVFVGPDRCLIKALHDMPIRPYPRPGEVEDLFAMLREVVTDFDDDVTVALLLTRPGRGPITRLDRHWAREISREAARFEVPIEPFFRANDESLVLVEPT